MQLERPTRHIKGLSAAVGLALGFALLATTALPARAGDDDDNPPLDKKILRGILEGLGLKRDGEAMINYQERAPLVIPPNSNLPPPEKGDTAIANNPNWPKDPDVQRAKEAKLHKDPRNETDIREEEQNPLRPDQLTPGGKPPRVAHDGDVEPNSATPGDRLSLKELNIKGGFFHLFAPNDEETVRFTGEPPRASLTDPPPGYQTPSPAQPYAAGKTHTEYHNTTQDYLSTHGTVDSGN